MSIFSSMFGGGSNQQQQPPASQQQPPQGQQSNGQPGQTNPPAQQSANPAAPTNVNGSNTPPDPTAVYAKMWENNPNKPDAAPSLRIDDKVLNEVSSSLKFSRNAPPELLQKAMSGDMASMMEMMDWTAQQAYKHAMQHQSVLTDQFVGQREDFQQKGFGKAVQQELTMNNLFAGESGKALPDYAKRQFSDAAKRFAAANPDASPQEVADATKEYFRNMAALAGGGTPTQQQEQKPAPMDWDKWASS
jgi:hypothetical protein